jgi:hypothetical protein
MTGTNRGDRRAELAEDLRLIDAIFGPRVGLSLGVKDANGAKGSFDAQLYRELKCLVEAMQVFRLKFREGCLHKNLPGFELGRQKLCLYSVYKRLLTRVKWG